MTHVTDGRRSGDDMSTRVLDQLKFMNLKERRKRRVKIIKVL